VRENNALCAFHALNSLLESGHNFVSAKHARVRMEQAAALPLPSSLKAHYDGSKALRHLVTLVYLSWLCAALPLFSRIDLEGPKFQFTNASRYGARLSAFHNRISTSLHARMPYGIRHGTEIAHIVGAKRLKDVQHDGSDSLAHIESTIEATGRQIGLIALRDRVHFGR
jgi:hypothetical protein